MSPRTLHPTTTKTLHILGSQVKAARKLRRWTAQELADRVGIDRSTLRKIEYGDPTVAIGNYFEAAVLTGVPLFSEDSSQVDFERKRIEDRLALLPSRVDKPRKVDDDF